MTVVKQDQGERSLGAGAVLCLLLVSGFLGAQDTPPKLEGTAGEPGKTGEAPTEKKKYYLIVDYLSPALYIKEPLTACFRLENTTKSKVTFKVKARVLGPGGREIRAHEKKVVVKAKSLAAYRHDHDLNGGVQVVFEFGPAKSIEKVVVQLLRDGAPWPKTVIRDGRVCVKESGAFLLPVVKRKKQDEERTWAPLKWALGKKKKNAKGARGAALVCLPGLWAEATTGSPKELFESYLSKAWRNRASENAVCKLGPYPLDGAIPILKATAGGLVDLKEGQKNPFRRAIIVLPPEDLEVSTDPRIYQVVLEAWLVRLRATGIKEVVLFPPFKYGFPLKRQQLLWAGTKTAARVQKARVESVEELIHEKLWRVDPSQKGMYGVRPNAEGRAAIAKVLAEWLPD